MIAIEKEIGQFHKQYEAVQQEMGRVIVGNREVIGSILSCLLTRGHVLLEGIPGLGKDQDRSDARRRDELEVQPHPVHSRSDAGRSHRHQRRPRDRDGDKYLDFQQGPIFCNLMLADEVNRATPKSQSALLEAMQEKSVSVGNITHKLEEPFFVMATQNPIELEGTYPLPEAQMDRFLFKLKIEYPNIDEMHQIMDRTTQVGEAQVQTVLEHGEVMQMRETVLSVPIAKPVQDYAIRLTPRHPPELNPSARSDEQVRALRGEPSRNPSARSRRQDASALERSDPRVLRGYPQRRHARASASYPSQLRR